MAYAATVTVTEYKLGAGRRHYLVSVAETGAGTTSEWSTAGGAGITLSTGNAELPPVIRVLHRAVYLTAGTATQVAPVLARATGITTAGINSIVIESAVSSLNDGSQIPRALPSRVLYGRSQSQGVSTDNAITTEILLVEGGQS